MVGAIVASSKGGGGECEEGDERMGWREGMGGGMEVHGIGVGWGSGVGGEGVWVGRGDGVEEGLGTRLQNNLDSACFCEWQLPQSVIPVDASDSFDTILDVVVFFSGGIERKAWERG